MAEMNLAERVRAEIVKGIANFLISDKNVPKNITVTLEYPESRAKISIDTEGIRNEFAKK